MRTIRWRDITQPGQKLHVATIDMKLMRSPSMHRHDFYECFLTLEGQGSQVTPEGEQPLEMDSLYFVRPEHAHLIKGQNLVFLNLAFEASLAEHLIAALNDSLKWWEPSSEIGYTSVKADQRQEIIELAMSTTPSQGEVNAAWLLVNLGRIITGSPSQYHHLGDVPEWLANGLPEATGADVLSEGVSKLVQIMGRSREHVTRSFRKHLGMTPTEWINRQRIDHACLLLSTTRLSVLEIAIECGYESPSYFHQAFRQTIHTTPLKYRQSLFKVQT